jgi:hypothetical protein
MKQVQRIISENERYINTFCYGEYYDPSIDFESLNDVLNKLKAIVAESGISASEVRAARETCRGYYDGANESILQIYNYLTSTAGVISNLQDSFVAREEQSHYFDLIQAYIDFSKKYGNVALYCNYPGSQADGNPLPHKKWVKFSGDSTVFKHGRNTSESYSSANAAELKRENVADVLELEGIDPESFSDEGISHWVSLDDAHASMIIPLKFYPEIKKILESKGVYVMEYDRK